MLGHYTNTAYTSVSINVYAQTLIWSLPTDSNRELVGFMPTASTNWARQGLVSPEGFEPSTKWLRATYSDR
jgi:hypothetical protein